MTDRELTELAAKAAGIEGEWGNEKYIEHYEGFIPTGWLRAWNPLDNDGDAFRLAVKVLPFHVLSYTREDYEYCNEDGLAATRRAIVRAAAEIGKGINDTY